MFALHNFPAQRETVLAPTFSLGWPQRHEPSHRFADEFFVLKRELPHHSITQGYPGEPSVLFSRVNDADFAVSRIIRSKEYSIEFKAFQKNARQKMAACHHSIIPPLQHPEASTAVRWATIFILHRQPNGCIFQIVDAVFKALADDSRRQLLDQLHQCNGQTLSQLCESLAMTRQGVTKHLALLEAAKLITVVWHGREKLHYQSSTVARDLRALDFQI